MLKFLLLSSFFIFTVNGQTEINVQCPAPDDNAVTMNFADINKKTWFEVYRSDKTETLQCTVVSYSVAETKIEVKYEGNVGKNSPKSAIVSGTIKGKGSYEVIEPRNYHHTFILFKKDDYAVIHECELKAGGVNSTSKFSILSSKPILNLLDLDTINKLLTTATFNKFVKLEDMNTVQHYGEICNSSSAVTALTSLIIACAALIKLF